MKKLATKITATGIKDGKKMTIVWRNNPSPEPWDLFKPTGNLDYDHELVLSLMRIPKVPKMRPLEFESALNARCTIDRFFDKVIRIDANGIFGDEGTEWMM